MFCKNCGHELNDNAIICPNCGVPTDKMQQTASAAPVEQKKPNGFAITALVLGLVGLVGGNYAFLIPGIIGLVFGIIGMVKSKQYSARGLAIAALVVSIVGLVIWLIIWIAAFGIFFAAFFGAIGGY